MNYLASLERNASACITAPTAIAASQYGPATSSQVRSKRELSRWQRSLIIAVLMAALGSVTCGATPQDAGAPTNSDSDLVTQAQITVAIAQFEGNDLESAQEAFAALVDTANGKQLATAHAYLGLIAQQQGDLDQAKKQLEQALRLEPSSNHHLWLGRVVLQELQSANFLKQGMLAPKVRGSFEKAVEIDPSNVQARISLGHYYLNAPAIAGGSTKKARLQAEAIIELAPAQGHAFLAEAHDKQGDLPAAIAAYQAAVRAAPEEHDHQHQLGLLYQKAEQWEQAFDTFEAIVADNPEHRAAIYQLGRTGALSGLRLERSMTMFRLFLDQHVEPDHRHAASAHWRLGMLHEHNSDPEAAAAAYREALEIDPDLREAREALANLESS